MRHWVGRLLGDVEGGVPHLLLGLATLGYLALVLPKWLPPLNESETLDGGYRAVLNEAWLNGWQSGTEVVTTCGPLGFLRNTIHYDGTDALRTGWAILLASALTVLFAKLLLDRSLLVSAINLGVAILFLALVKQQGWLLLPVIGLLFLFAKVVDRQPRTAPWEIFLTALLATSSLVLFVELISGSIVVAGVALIHHARFRKLSPVPLAFGAFLLLAWVGSGQTVSAIPQYLRASVEVAAGYGEVMALPCDEWWWSIAGAAALLLVVGTSVREVASTEGWKLAAALGCPLFAVGWLVFKSAFTRCQISRVVVYSMILGFVALAALNVARRLRGDRGWPPSSVLAVACCLLLGFSYLGTLGTAAATGWMTVGLQMPYFRASELVSRLGAPQRIEQRHAVERASIRKRYPLPAIDGAVDWFGDRQGILLAHDLDFRPRPVYQRFNAYTPFLAELNAEHYAGPKAPDAVVFDARGFDAYPLMLFDGPALLRLVESYYASGPLENKLLVLCRGPRRPTARTLALESTVRIGEWVDLAAATGGHDALWVEVEVTDTLFGRVAQLAFRGDRLWLDVELESGAYHRFLFAAPPGRSGFWLSPFLVDGTAVERLFRYGLDSLPDDARVRAVRLYQPPVKVRQRLSATFRVSVIAPRGPSISPMAPGAFSRATVFVDGFESGSVRRWAIDGPVGDAARREPP